MERLRQILQNLLSNALKFTEQGRVDVEVARMSLDEVPAEHRPDSRLDCGYLDQLDHDYIRVRVSDSGIGIPQDRQHMLFDAFSQVDPSTTRKYGGTGLGLAICKRLVEGMGGAIWVESTEGEGATFSFVVRVLLVTHGRAARAETAAPGVDRAPPRIATDHPCDILIFGGPPAAESLLLACRKLGYVPHHREDYTLDENALLRRKYDIVFICMGDAAKALQLSRQVAAVSGTYRPNAIIAYGVDLQQLSARQLELAGMQYWLEGVPDIAAVRARILQVLTRAVERADQRVQPCEFDVRVDAATEEDVPLRFEFGYRRLPSFWSLCRWSAAGSR